MAGHWHAALAADAMMELPSSQCCTYELIKSTKHSAAIFAAPHWVGKPTTPIVALVKNVAITHSALIAPRAIAALSVLIALIVLGRADYADGAEWFEGANGACRANCAECVLVLVTLATPTAVAMLVAVIALRVLIVLKYPQLHGRE